MPKSSVARAILALDSTEDENVVMLVLLRSYAAEGVQYGTTLAETGQMTVADLIKDLMTATSIEGLHELPIDQLSMLREVAGMDNAN